MSGNGFDGVVTLSAPSTWQDLDNDIGGSLYVNNYTGNVGYVELPNADGDALYLAAGHGNPYTISAFAMVNAVPLGPAEANNWYAFGIVIREGRHTGIWYGQDQKFHATHHFATVSGDSVSINVTSVSSFGIDNQFHHVAAVFEPVSRTFTLYVDGIEEDTINYPATGYDPYGLYLPWRFGVAKSSTHSTNDWGMLADINIDEVRIYNRALSALEIAALANQ